MKHADARNLAERHARRTGFSTVVFVTGPGAWSWSTYQEYLHGPVNPLAVGWDSLNTEDENANLLKTATAYMEATWPETP